MTTPAQLARALHGVIEPLYAIAYFADECTAAYEQLGLEPKGQGYVAGRACVLGAVGPAPTAAIFYNFNPGLIQHALPGAWEITTPEAVLEARATAMEAFFTRVQLPTEGRAEATALAAEAGALADCTGRPLAAANAAVAAPGTPYGDLWQALGVLREHRGDGHVALLVAERVGPVEALVLYAGWQEKVSRRFLQRSRLWDDAAWDAAAAALRTRGWLDDSDRLTDEGSTTRERLEGATDELASGPYEALGVARSQQLFALLRPLAVALDEAGAWPRALSIPPPDAAG